eukprot:CAMPEP_0178770650 /NCGR_PEP_ID=MMETSP0744-20121128/21516_1 /TAXON_ID=913974 /ORGANISM="Nitzschia punctata, Strain CCMP561" /LENGTH=377 /DNA_ID=CAMNT_0020427063 /DNA_START=90 /DNA_END=1223 /DNA_ORIENTATION=-
MMKTTLFCSMMVAVQLPSAHGWTEFGRERTADNLVQRKRVLGWSQAFDSDHSMGDQQSLGKGMEESLQDIVDARSVLEVSMSMGGLPSVPTVGPPSAIPPAGPPGPSAPSMPTSRPPSSGFEPTSEPTSPTTGEPTESFEPSVSADPTTSPVVTDDEGECLGNGLSLVSASDADSTPLFLAVGYQAESTSSTIERFVNELEDALIDTAIVAMLGCATETSRLVFPQTLEVASCTPQVDTAAGCFVMETEAVIFLSGPVDEDVAIFEAYRAIQESMRGDRYIGVVPTILRLEFLSPLPLPVPPGVDNDADGGATPVSSRGNESAASPWAIGASVASVMGGFISILVWARARRFRQRRQQLMDDTSWANGDSGSPISSE